MTIVNNQFWRVSVEKLYCQTKKKNLVAHRNSVVAISKTKSIETYQNRKVYTITITTTTTEHI